MSNVIEINELTKYYGSVRGIDKLSLCVNQGDFYGFIGPNGAGKSTTIRSLLGLIYPDSGSAQLLGLDIRGNQREIHRRIGYLPGEAAFYSGMRVSELLKFSARLRRKSCNKEALELCERLALDPSRKCNDLSYGNRKKAAIVCCLQHSPELIMLDEPTGGLDPLMQREFFEILRERRANGATVFLSSHILSEVQQYCENAAIIRNGKIIASGAVAELGSSRARRITLTGTIQPPILPGMRDVSVGEDKVSFLYDGDINALTAEVSKLTLSDMTVTEPGLEEIFLHYYEQEASK